MKIKFLMLFLISFFSAFSQTSKTDKINIGLIVETTEPILSEFLTTEKPNSNYELKEYDFEFKFGEYKTKEKPNRIDTLKYNDKGILKYDCLNSHYISGNDGYKNRSYLGYPIKLGDKGELLNKPNLKYKYNSKGQIIDLIEYSEDGSIIKSHYSFNYNAKNQITEIQHYWNGSNSIDHTCSYYYNVSGDIILMKNFTKTTRKNFPKCEHFKSILNYNNKNQLTSYHSYETKYGGYWEIGSDMYKYIKGKEILKTYEENQKELKESYQEYQNYEYKYENNNNVWTSRTEYSVKPYLTIPKEYIKIVYQTELK
jgi:hypothetical protein